MTQQALIQDQQKSELKRTLRKDLKAEVQLRLFTQRPSPISVPGRECRYCVQTQQLLEELVDLSPKVTLETTDVYAQPWKKASPECRPSLLAKKGKPN